MNPFAATLSRALARLPGNRAAALRLELRLVPALGPALASRVRLRVEGRRVLLMPRDPRWTRELTAMSGTLLERLQAVAGEVESVEIREAVWEPPRARTVVLPEAVALSAGTEASLARLGDGELRRRLRELAGKSLGARERRKGTR